MGLAKSGVRTLNFGRVIFRLFKELLDEIWEAVLRGKGVEESWLLFKDAFLRAKELSVPQKRGGGRQETSMAWQRPAGQTEGEDGQVLTVETRVCQLGRIQGWCPDLQRWD